MLTATARTRCRKLACPYHKWHRTGSPDREEWSPNIVRSHVDFEDCRMEREGSSQIDLVVTYLLRPSIRNEQKKKYKEKTTAATETRRENKSRPMSPDIIRSRRQIVLRALPIASRG